MMDLEGLRSRLAEYNQDHLLKYWDQLDDEHKIKLFKDVSSVDVERMCNTYDTTISNSKVEQELSLEPIPQEYHDSLSKTSPADFEKYHELGLEQIRNGKVAALLLAGGQGTRLGVSYPKGMYNVGLPSRKTLYQLQAERIIKLQKLASKSSPNSPAITWYIMTSEHTKEPTLEFFENHNFFNLDRDNIKIFEQNMIPCFNKEDGKILLEQPWKISRAPDGNGGLYCVLQEEGILDDMRSRGIEYIHVYCVDNILVKMADPDFIGYCITKNADCGAKVVEKEFPEEKVGVVCKVNGKYQVVEYSELPNEAANEKNSEGQLIYNAGSICNHFFTIDFLERMARGKELKHHIAEKKIPCLDSNGQHIKPKSNNGIKLEKFVFDVFEFAERLAVWEVPRQDEFSPLKNADGTAAQDTPTTCRQSLFNLHRRYVLNAGGKLPHQNEIAPSQSSSCSYKGDGVCVESTCSKCAENICEISARLSYNGEGLEEACSGKEFTYPILLSHSSETLPMNGDCC